MNHHDPFNRFCEEEPYDHKHGQQTQMMKSIDLTHSRLTTDDGQYSLRQHDDATNQSKPSTLTSIMTSPITAKLTSFSTFMPFSWGSASGPSPAAMCVTPPMSDSGMGSLPSDQRLDGEFAQHQQPTKPKKCGFVTRQQQLEKLKKRMEMEGRRRMNFDVVLHCKNCADGTVVL